MFLLFINIERDIPGVYDIYNFVRLTDHLKYTGNNKGERGYEHKIRCTLLQPGKIINH